jgi:hypothetical protein
MLPAKPPVCAEYEKTLQKCIVKHDDETCRTIFKIIHIGFYNACVYETKEISLK